MEKYLQAVADFLANNDWSEEELDFAILQDELVEQMEAEQIGLAAIQPILELMEKHPLVEFGTPGAFTHFIEQFYKDNSTYYEEILLQSVLKQPTVHTVWLLNRVINGTSPETAKVLIQTLKSIADDTAQEAEIRMAADSFFKYHL